jgi:hypothetical protein
MGNKITIDVDANETASDALGNVANSSKKAEKVIVNSMGTTEAAFDTAARGTGKLGDALDKTEGVTGKLGEGVSGVSDVIDSFNDISNHGAEKQRALARAQIDVKQAANDAKQAVEDQAQAQRDLAQSGIDAEQSQIDEKQAIKDGQDAQQAYNDALKKGKAGASDAKQALIDLSQAQLDQKQAQEDGKQAQRDASQAHIDGTQAMIDQKGAAVDLSEAQSNLSSQTSTLGKVSDYANMFGGALSGLSGVIGIITVVQWAWNASLLASPITWIVIGIIAVVAVIVLLATKTQFFQTIWKAVWDFMKMVGNWFAGPFKDAMVAVWHAIQVAAEAVGHALVVAWNSTMSFFKGIGAWFAGPFANFFKSAWKGIGNAFTSVKNSVINGISSIISKATGWVNYFLSIPGKLAGKLGNMFAPVWNGFRSMLNLVIRGWNSLRFTIPGFSFLGYQVDSFSLGVPRIPYLASGGDVLKGGVAFLHQGERVTDKATTQRLDRIDRSQPQYDAASGELRIVLELKFDPTGDPILDEILDGIRGYVKSAGGGNVQVALGRGSSS